MTTYNVTPKAGDLKGWKVEANGRTTSRHNKKRPALDAAQRRANSGDTIVIHGTDGRVLERRTVR